MELADIFSKKRSGDFVTAGIIVGKTPDNARQALNNPKSKNHKPVVEALEKIIQARETLINN